MTVRSILRAAADTDNRSLAAASVPVRAQTDGCSSQGCAQERETAALMCGVGLVDRGRLSSNFTGSRPDRPNFVSEFEPLRSSDWLVVARSEQETEALGRALARVLERGTVIALVGNLGAGKTRLTQALAAELGVERENVTSPTFVLIQEYDGRLPIYHFDTYRLRDTDEFLELGADELMAGGGVCVIEWADRVADVLPRDVLRIEITILSPTDREFRFSATGTRSRRVVDRLRAGWAAPQ